MGLRVDVGMALSLALRVQVSSLAEERMNLQQQQIAVDHLTAIVRQQGVIKTDPVDFVEFLLAGVSYRDLDAIADDIVSFVLRWDDLRQHVRDRLDVHLALAEAGRRDDPRRTSE